MLIYAEQITPRLHYIAEVFFEDCRFTSSPVEFFEADGPKINYSQKRFSDNEFHIHPCGLVNEAGIKNQIINTGKWNGLKIFFLTKGDIPFDIFSASFFLLSRYEEYLPHQKDSYGRFAHTESLAYKEYFLQLPLVSFWMQALYDLLQQRFPAYNFPVKEFRFVPTYDIDIAFAERGWARKVINLVKGRKTKLNGRDVFDVYDWLSQLHQHYRLSPLYFFLLAKRRGKYDKNVSPRSKKLQQLIKKTAAIHTAAIHPSWASYHDERALEAEIKTLAGIANIKVNASRQHYIQFTLPHTFRQLTKAGITHDYSMGYGSINGFRASYASPFYWYDLLKEEKTSLLLHPFCYMEANSCFEQKFSVDEAGKELQYYSDVVKKVNGELVTIFHNHFLTEEKQWLPWREMYASFLSASFSK